MKVQSTVLAFATAFTVISGACTTPGQTPGTGGSSSSGGSGTGSGGSSSGTGGNNSSSGGSSTGGTTGSGSGGGGGSCPNVSACGGDAVGVWTAMSSCLKLSGTLDITLAGLDPKTCIGPTIDGSMTVTGTWTANANGTYTDQTMTKGTAKLTMPAGCLMLSGTTTDCEHLESPLTGIGFSEVDCSDAPSGGGCNCTGTIQQTGGIGLPSVDPQKSGNFKTSGNMLTNDGTANFSYCAMGNSLTLSPQGWASSISGTIVLQKGGNTGTGGSGTGGMIIVGTGGGSAGGKGGAGGKAAGGTTATGGASAGGSSGTGGVVSTNRADGPCDVYAAANTPCVAAYSMVRGLTKTYTGFLYQVRSGSSAMNTGTGGMLKDIGMTADGFADTATQDAFCSGTICTVSLLYDHSGKKNNLKVAPKGLSNGGTYAAMDDFESSATKGMLMIGGHKVYSLYMNAREGYRLTAKGAGVPLGNTSEGIYMLADGTHSGTACCWDFGNVSTDPTKYGVMNTLFLGTGFWGKGAGSGPWFLGDFEGGVWAGGSGASTAVNNNSPSMKVPFALGFLKTSPGKYAIRMANIQSATELTTAYDGASPKTWNNEGGILIGIGGDNSNNSWGTFYEGAITAGLPSNDTDLAIMKNIQAAGYGK